MHPKSKSKFLGHFLLGSAHPEKILATPMAANRRGDFFAKTVAPRVLAVAHHRKLPESDIYTQEIRGEIRYFTGAAGRHFLQTQQVVNHYGGNRKQHQRRASRVQRSMLSDRERSMYQTAHAPPAAVCTIGHGHQVRCPRIGPPTELLYRPPMFAFRPQ